MRDYLRRIKYVYQRAVRGYDDTLFWDLAEYLDPIIIAFLTNLRDNGMGYPHGMTETKWKKTLDIMIKGFSKDKYAWTKKDMEKRKEALVLFAYWYDNLWD